MGDFKGKGKRVKVKEMGKSSIFHMCRLRKAEMKIKKKEERSEG